MRRFVKTAIVAAGCLALTACPQVKSVQGSVTGPQREWKAGWGGISNRVLVKGLRQGNTLEVGAEVNVGPGSSITLTVMGKDGKNCDLTYRTSFIVVEPVDCKKQQDDNDNDNDNDNDSNDNDSNDNSDNSNDDRQQSSQQQDAQQSSQQWSEATPQNPSPQGNAMRETSRSRGGSGGGGITGSTTTSTAVTTGTGLTTLQTTLVTVASVAAGKLAYDKIKKDDKPISK